MVDPQYTEGRSLNEVIAESRGKRVYLTPLSSKDSLGTILSTDSSSDNETRFYRVLGTNVDHLQCESTVIVRVLPTLTRDENMLCNNRDPIYSILLGADDRLEAVELRYTTLDGMDSWEVEPKGFLICKNQQIPEGHVIIAEESKSDCPGSFPNAWRILRPGPTAIVCKNSPIPPDYVITGERSRSQCPGSFPNAWEITKTKSGCSTLPPSLLQQMRREEQE